MCATTVVVSWFRTEQTSAAAALYVGKSVGTLTMSNAQVKVGAVPNSTSMGYWEAGSYSAEPGLKVCSSRKPRRATQSDVLTRTSIYEVFFSYIFHSSAQGKFVQIMTACGGTMICSGPQTFWYVVGWGCFASMKRFPATTTAAEPLLSYRISAAVKPPMPFELPRSR